MSLFYHDHSRLTRYIILVSTCPRSGTPRRRDKCQSGQDPTRKGLSTSKHPSLIKASPMFSACSFSGGVTPLSSILANCTPLSDSNYGQALRSSSFLGGSYAECESTGLQ